MQRRSFFSLATQLTALSLIAASTFYSATTLAAGIKGKNRTFPYGCRVMGYSYQNDLLIIKPSLNPPTPTTGSDPNATQTPAEAQKSDKPFQTMYLIHNKTGRDLGLKTQKEEGEAYKPDNENIISPNQWAAFAMDSEQIKFACTQGGTAVNCETALEVCEYNHAKFSDSTLGTYWVIKTDTLENAVYGAIHIGILLRW